jgi:tetraprenyl-beta-curcumene synthase
MPPSSVSHRQSELRLNAARLFASAGHRYWLQVFPAARDCQRRLLARAQAIPDPVLREDALISHLQKGSNSEGLAALAVLAPKNHRKALAQSLVAYQLMLDYLDGVSERPAADPLSNGLCLHQAFEVALDPEAGHEDYYAQAPAGDDGGYLIALIETCRAPLRALPSYQVARPALLNQAGLCRQSQALNHALHFSPEEDKMIAWAAQTARAVEIDSDLDWWELIAAAAASSLCIGALLALAATPKADEADARQVERAYFPWASALNALLDSLIDLDEDAEVASHLRRYASFEGAAKRLATITTMARGRLGELPEGHLHEAIFAAMGALYLKQPAAWHADREEMSRAVLAALGPYARPAILIHLLRRREIGRGPIRSAWLRPPRGY